MGSGFIKVDSNYNGVFTRFGKYIFIKDSGLTWIPTPFFLKGTKVFMGQRSFELRNSKVVDLDGKPIQLSAITNYKVVKPQLFALVTENSSHYVNLQAEAAIKSIASEYKYDELTRENSSIKLKMKSTVQALTECIGIEITDLHLTELNYAPEMASSLLLKQQAQAYIDAKKEIGDAYIGIVNDILKNLEYNNLSVTEETRDKLICNLLTVISSGNTTQPVLNM